MGCRRWVFGLLAALGVTSLAACRSVEEKLVEERVRFEERYGPIPTEEELAELVYAPHLLAAIEATPEPQLDGEKWSGVPGIWVNWTAEQRAEFERATEGWGDPGELDALLSGEATKSPVSEPSGLRTRDPKIESFRLVRWLRNGSLRAGLDRRCDLALQRLDWLVDLAVATGRQPGMLSMMFARTGASRVLAAAADLSVVCPDSGRLKSLDVLLGRLAAEMPAFEWAFRSDLALTDRQYPEPMSRLIGLRWTGPLIEATRRRPLEQGEGRWTEWLAEQEGLDTVAGELLIPNIAEAIAKDALYRTELDLARAAVCAALQLHSGTSFEVVAIDPTLGSHLIDETIEIRVEDGDDGQRLVLELPRSEAWWWERRPRSRPPTLLRWEIPLVDEG